MSTSLLFGASVSAQTIDSTTASENPNIAVTPQEVITSGTYTANTTGYTSITYCIDEPDTTQVSFKGGSVKYGCYDGVAAGIKPFTEYRAITKTPTGTAKGTTQNHNSWSNHAEYTITSTGDVKHQVEFMA